MLAAIVAGWLIRHWTLGVAALAGGTAGVFLVPSLPADAQVLTPAFTGFALSGLVLIPLLAWRPDMEVWTRMSVTMVAALGAHALFLQYALVNY